MQISAGVPRRGKHVEGCNEAVHPRAIANALAQFEESDSGKSTHPTLAEVSNAGGGF